MRAARPRHVRARLAEGLEACPSSRAGAGAGGAVRLGELGPAEAAQDAPQLLWWHLRRGELCAAQVPRGTRAGPMAVFRQYRPCFRDEHCAAQAPRGGTGGWMDQSTWSITRPSSRPAPPPPRAAPAPPDPPRSRPACPIPLPPRLPHPALAPPAPPRPRPACLAHARRRRRGGRSEGPNSGPGTGGDGRCVLGAAGGSLCAHGSRGPIQGLGEGRCVGKCSGTAAHGSRGPAVEPG